MTPSSDAPRYWFTRPPMEPIVKSGSFRAYGHTIGPAQRQLEQWVAGRPLSEKLPPVWTTEGYDRDFRGYLRIEGEAVAVARGMRWTVFFAQYGDPESNGGMVSGAASAEDACDQALELIREHEEQLLAAVVVGVA